jgi:hypothetical protein
MADKPIDHEFLMHAYRAGGHQARQKMMELKEELKVYHNQAGSKVIEGERGCFGGALNAWIRAGEPREICTVWLMAITEGFAVTEVCELIKTEIFDGEMERMGQGEVDEFVAYKMRLGPAEISGAEQKTGEKWCVEQAVDGLARYEE